MTHHMVSVNGVRHRVEDAIALGLVAPPPPTGRHAADEVATAGTKPPPHTAARGVQNKARRPDREARGGAQPRPSGQQR